ncbi:MAG: DJ-1/PfpI family protein [Tyzzerella sp.]|nr:DJ-1/PfpI family protein [Tyzzerella sp.]
MAKKVSVFLADGFEEIEGLTVVDLLRRAGVEVTTVSIMGVHTIHGAHKIDVQADKLFDEVDYEEMDMVVLPGGMPGTLNLGAHEGVKQVLEQFYAQKKCIGAICAAPSVLGKYGMLEGRKATSYPGFEEELKGAEYTTDAVAVSDFVITSRGLGTAIEFSLALIEKLIDKKKADEISHSIIYK